MVQKFNFEKIETTKEEEEDKIDVWFDTENFTEHHELESCSKDVAVIAIDQNVLDFTNDNITKC